MTFVKRIAGAGALCATLLLGPCLLPRPAQAAYYLTLEQLGSDVVAIGAGTIDTTDLVPEALGVFASGNMFP